MNEVFLMGTIITDIDFKFIIKSKKQKSVAIFKMKTIDKQIINIRAYNEMADNVYHKFIKNDFVFIYGSLAINYVRLIYIKQLTQ